MDHQFGFKTYRYQLLIATYLAVTGLCVLRIGRQPYSRSLKLDQIESVFKATTLSTLILGIGISGKLNQSRSTV